MKIYLAPMEGITGEVYRRAYHTFFEPMDKYFTPFLNPTRKANSADRNGMRSFRRIMRACIPFRRS